MSIHFSFPQAWASPWILLPKCCSAPPGWELELGQSCQDPRSGDHPLVASPKRPSTLPPPDLLWQVETSCLIFAIN